MSTYTFDNLWLDDDFHLTKENDVWYVSLYKLDLSKTGRLVDDIKEGTKLNRQFSEDVRIKTKRARLNLTSIKHGAQIDDFYGNHKKVSVNYPGGLIRTIINSFNNQLKKGGIFITADLATAGKKVNAKGFESVNETIKIKIENYALAKIILGKLGYSVELKDLCEFIKDSGIITPVEIHDHYVLVVTRKSA